MIFYFLLTIFGGVTLSLQKLVNAALGKHIGSIESSFMNHFVGAVFSALFLLLGFYTGKFHIEGIPFYLFLGGVCGVFLVFALNYAIPLLGAMASLIFLIFAQLVLSSCIDHFGWFQAKVVVISPMKIVGVLLVFLSAILVLQKPKAH